MEYNATSGAWLNAENVEDGETVKLVNECVMQTSKFKDDEGNPKMENVVKARFESMDEPVNMRLNWTTVYGLVEAFGKDSKMWIGHKLIAKTKDATTGISVYLIPEGSKLVRNEKKRWEVRREVEEVEEKPKIKSKKVSIEPVDIRDMDFTPAEERTEETE